jgi:hypothetical protein
MSHRRKKGLRLPWVGSGSPPAPRPAQVASESEPRTDQDIAPRELSGNLNTVSKKQDTASLERGSAISPKECDTHAPTGARRLSTAAEQSLQLASASRGNRPKPCSRLGLPWRSVCYFASCPDIIVLPREGAVPVDLMPWPDRGSPVVCLGRRPTHIGGRGRRRR